MCGHRHGLGKNQRRYAGRQKHYDIDLFKDLLTAVAAEVVAAGGESSAHHDTPSHRVIADHIRAAAFLLADGVMPSNEGRGYVLRRIIRRALRHGHKLGARQAFFYRLAATLPPLFGKAHPVIVPRLPLIEKTLRAEEESFSTMLQHGMNILRREIDHLGGQKELPGAVVFKLYDTYGFPADMTADILREENLTADMAGFDACMAQQRARSRAAMTFNIGAKTAEFDGAATEFWAMTKPPVKQNIGAFCRRRDNKRSASGGRDADYFRPHALLCRSGRTSGRYRHAVICRRTSGSCGYPKNSRRCVGTFCGGE